LIEIRLAQCLVDVVERRAAALLLERPDDGVGRRNEKKGERVRKER